MNLYHQCKHCGRELGFDDKICPFCGADLKKQRILGKAKKLLIFFAAGALLLSIGGQLLRKPYAEHSAKRGFHSQSDTLREKRKLLQAPFPHYEEDLNVAAGEDCSTIWEDPERQQATEKELSIEDKALFNDALCSVYLLGGMSQKQYLEDMLRRGYSREDALRILPLLEVNWNHQALEACLFTFGYTGQSRVKAENTLLHMGFAPEQVQYAMDHVHPDYGQQAVLTLYERLHVSHMSPRDARWALEDALYTEEEIQWAMENCGIDWKEMAYEAGFHQLGIDRSYEDSVIDSLIKIGYAPEQIRYAAGKLSIPISQDQEWDLKKLEED